MSAGATLKGGVCMLALSALLGAASAYGGQDMPAPAGMVWIPGGEFIMGSTSEIARADERPVHKVKVDGFWMDATEVTNGEFQRFVDATGYVTTAEQKPRMEDIVAQLPPGSPPPPVENLTAGALVFVPPRHDEWWWQWVPGANWRHPQGPESSIKGLENHPVVQVSWFDAFAYAKWAGKRLPTEAEWEYAARGGLQEKTYSWGEQPPGQGKPRANIWQGEFPKHNVGSDGYVGTSPVRSYEPNGYGLYDMAGNVWEWVQDWYRPDTYLQRSGQPVSVNPLGPADSLDPEEPFVPKRVQRGGSHLCEENFCAGYRPGARMKAGPDTGLIHAGFRCVRSPDPR